MISDTASLPEEGLLCHCVAGLGQVIAGCTSVSPLVPWWGGMGEWSPALATH